MAMKKRRTKMNLTKDEVLALRAVLYGCITNRKIFIGNGTFVAGIKHPEHGSGSVKFEDAVDTVAGIIDDALREEGEE